MKLDTNKYKLSLFTERVCDDCNDLKKRLKDLNIPFTNKCITPYDGEDGLSGNQIKENVAHRWDFVDAEKDNPGKIKFTPVMILEHSSGTIEYYSAGAAFENNNEAIEILKKYCI
jgi:hypothetical protein|tara:strand:+ start:616 stop:960 length:345 start_codon:yes stop_codon:yes gene_type:complete